MRTILCFAAVTVFLLSVSCSSSSSNNAGASAATQTPSATPPTTGDAQPQSPKAETDPCSLFSPEDAQAITEVPMKLAPGHGAIVCMYVETSPTPGLDTARISLMLNEASSVEEEAKEWKYTKEMRRLKPGEKNVSQLSGIGEEAWFEGHAEKGKVGLGGILVRNGKADFALQSAVMQPRASLEKMKDISRRIAAKLQ